MSANTPAETFVRGLLAQMSLEEKIAQLCGVFSNDILEGNRFCPTKAARVLRHGVGNVAQIAGQAIEMSEAKRLLTPEEVAACAAELQAYLREHTRLGIPAIIHDECLAGFQAPNATVFPQSIGLAATWNPDLARAMTDSIRRVARSLGSTMALSPVLDVSIEPRFGRVEETYGEDPHLASAMGVAFIQGLQGHDLSEGIAATGKHFCGYGFVEAGRNCYPVRIGPREFLEKCLLPFEACIKEAGLRSIMNAYHEIDNVPCAASRELLTKILREDWGFVGVVVSDYFSIDLLQSLYKMARDKAETAALAFNAGMTVDLPCGSVYREGLPEAVARGLVREEAIDAAVLHVLRLKHACGLFQAPCAPAVAPYVTCGEDQALARAIAAESIVLLKNEGDILPLAEPRRILVTGPNAVDALAIFGDYTFPVLHRLHAAHGHDAADALRAVSVLEGLSQRYPQAEIVHQPGCDYLKHDEPAVEAACAAAATCDVVVAVLGENSWTLTGEGRDRPDIELPSVQLELLQRLAETGKPVIVVLINGRPVSLRRIAPYARAILTAWYPGEQGGAAVAAVLSGDVNPSGRLPITFPQETGHIPVYYQKPPGSFLVFGETAQSVAYETLYATCHFGFGLGYTRFHYEAFALQAASFPTDGELVAQVTVRNTGDRAGAETVQVYFHDCFAPLRRPQKELKAFRKVWLEPGEARTLTLRLPIELLAFHDDQLDLVVEPGEHRIQVGSSSLLIHCQQNFQLTGERRRIGRRSRFFAQFD